jgi:hypothetical protein
VYTGISIVNKEGIFKADLIAFFTRNRRCTPVFA